MIFRIKKERARGKTKVWNVRMKRVKDRERQSEREKVVENISIIFLKFGPRLNQRLCVQMVKCVLGCGPASG